jgi:hypothetical protein
MSSRSRAWISLAESASVFDFNKTSPVARRAFTSAVIRFGFTPLIRVSVRNRAPAVVWRCACLNFGRFAADRRRALLAFECLAKTVG